MDLAGRTHFLKQNSCAKNATTNVRKHLVTISYLNNINVTYSYLEFTHNLHKYIDSNYISTYFKKYDNNILSICDQKLEFGISAFKMH